MVRLSNKNKLQLSILGLLLTGLLASATVAYYQVRSSMLDAVRNEQFTKANAATARLNLWLDQSLNLVSSVAQALSESDEPLEDNPNYQFFARQVVNSGQFIYISYGLESGYYWSHNWQPFPGYDPRNRPWYLEAKHAETPIVTDPFVGAGETRHYISVAAPIVRAGQFEGVISGDLTLEFVQQTILGLDLSMNATALLLNREGNVLIHPKRSLQNRSLPGLNKDQLRQTLATLDQSTLLETSKDYLMITPVHNSGWLLAFALPKSVLMYEIYQRTIVMLAHFLGIFVAVSGLFLLYNRQIITPILTYLEQDSVTGLPNKKHFKQYVTDQFLEQKRDGILLLISTNNFSRITAAYPTDTVVELQRAISQRIQSHLDRHSILGVFSESRFIAYLPLSRECNEQTRLQELDALIHELSEFYPIHDQQINCSFRIGVSVFPQHGHHLELLIDKAFAVMASRSKTEAADIGVYKTDIDAQLGNELLLTSAMHNALRHQEFYMEYQPLFDLEQHRFTSAEALVRWYSKELDRQVSPAEFIPIAESSNLIISIGNYVIDCVARQIQEWQKDNINFRKIGINLSPKQLQHEQFLPNLLKTLEHYQVSPSCIELEITETSLLEQPEKIIELLYRLKAEGFGIAIDDFGTGYSSLQYLKEIPFETLKIDQSFIRNLENNPKDQVIVAMLTNMARALDFKVLAEGVESEQQLRYLQQTGCHMVQGYYYARPLPADAVGVMLDPETA